MNRLKPNAVEKCKAILQKVKTLYKKELEEHEFTQRMKDIEDHKLFLRNCVKKMKDDRFQSSSPRYLRNLEDLLYIIENRKLTKENIGRCDKILKLLNAKIEMVNLLSSLCWI